MKKFIFAGIFGSSHFTNAFDSHQLLKDLTQLQDVASPAYKKSYNISIDIHTDIHVEITEDEPQETKVPETESDHPSLISVTKFDEVV